MTTAEQIAREEYPNEPEYILYEKAFIKGYTRGQQDRWIPVSERLPEVNVEVMAFEVDGVFTGDVWIATRLSDTAWQLGDYDEPFIVEANRITHWMPMPARPLPPNPEHP